MKVIYAKPECEVYIGELEAMTQKELLHFAKNCNDCEIYYTLADFQEAFNMAQISDLGHIFFINL